MMYSCDFFALTLVSAIASSGGFIWLAFVVEGWLGERSECLCIYSAKRRCTHAAAFVKV